MTRVRRSCLALAALALLVTSGVGCQSAAPLTELVVVVQADVPVPVLHLSVTTPEGTTPVDLRLASPQLPLTVVLTRDHAPYGPVTVHADGGGTSADAAVDLVVGERRRLDVALTESCLCASCGAGQTCRAGTCVSRSVQGSTLPVWNGNVDAGVAPPLDAGRADAGPLPDAGPATPTCGCEAQPCCASDRCHGTFSCRSGTCMSCLTSAPDVSGTTPAGATRLVGLSAMNDMLFVSYELGGSVNQMPLALSGGVTAAGTAVVGEVNSITASGATIRVTGVSGATGMLTLSGATATGGFTAPVRTGMSAVITRAGGSGATITLTAWDGSTGTITLAPVEVCR